MSDKGIHINSLRLSRVFGGGCCDEEYIPAHHHIQWFYNGSTKWEEDISNPRIFADLTGAVGYFTEKTHKRDRTVGQFVTFAEATRRNWIVYIYMGPDVEDENYSNPIFWHPFGEVRLDPYTDIDEVLQADKALSEKLKADIEIKEILESVNSDGSN